MKLTKAQVIGIVVAVLGSIAVANYDKLLPYHWQTFHSTDNTFTVTFPGKPIIEEQPVSSSLTLHILSTRPNDEVAYSCMWMEDPNLSTRSAEEALSAARDGSLRNVQGTLVTEKQTTVQGHPARDIQARARGNSVLDSRMVIVGNRMYVLMIVNTGGGERDTKNIQKFFDSFKTS